ncbi:MAG: helix-turn-helix domain-containing protein [Acidilobaceae archaeon]|nr:helix-turn-helix domain-containing protein [Acidilobaceae archaeon]
MALAWGVMEEGARETLYKTIGAVYDNVSDFAVLEYPRSSSRRSIDMTIRLRDGRISLLKVVGDLARFTRAEAEELKLVASALNASSLVIAERTGEEELLDDVAYEKHGVNVVTPTSLERALENERIYVYQSGDVLKVRVNSEELRKRRSERGMSLGELAHELGVSRKAVYEYERGTMDPSVERGEKLLELFGEEVLLPIDLFAAEKEEGRVEPDTPEEAAIADLLARLGFRVAHAKRAALDIAAKRGEEKISLVVEHGKESAASFLAKYLNALKLSRVVRSESYAVAESPHAARVLREEGVEAYSRRELIEILRRGLRG